MKTTIDIPENELRDAIRFTKARTKREAVVKVLETSECPLVARAWRAAAARGGV